MSIVHGPQAGPKAAARSEAQLPCVTKGSRRPAPGGRLENVEKFVRSSETRLDELEDFACEMVDRLLDRIEALEALMGVWRHE